MKELSLDAERCRLYRERKDAVEKMREALASGSSRSEEVLWEAVIAFQGYPFYTASGLLFRYTLKSRKKGVFEKDSKLDESSNYTKELWIDRREQSKSLAWSSVRLAFWNALRMEGEISGPKALGNIRGVSYIYPLLWRFGVITVPDDVAVKMKGEKCTI